jgi:hypothetical protein
MVRPKPATGNHPDDDLGQSGLQVVCLDNLGKNPNADAPPRLEAGASYERTQQAVSSTAWSGQHETLALGFWRRISKLQGRVNPELHRLFDVLQGRFLGFTMCRTPREFGHLGDKHLICVAPVDDDLVFLRDTSPPRGYFKMTRRTW